jgi:PAS domain-containing protein
MRLVSHLWHGAGGSQGRRLAGRYPGDRADVPQNWKAGLAARANADGKYRILCQDDSVVWVYGQVARDPAGKTIGYIGSITDISEIKRVQGQLAQCSMLQATMDATNDAILVTDPERNMESCNQRLLDLYRTTRDVFELPADERLAILSKSIRDPEAFSARAREIYQAP